MGCGWSKSSPQAGFEALSESVPFVSLGSGKPNADPFLSFLRSVFWPDRLPTVQEAITTAYWTIKFVSELGTEGVGLGIEAIVLERDNDGFAARKQDSNTLLENEDFISAACDALKSVPEGAPIEAAAPSEAAAEIPTMGSSPRGSKAT